MRTVLVKSAPALAVLVVLAVGFIAASILMQDIEASPSDSASCEYYRTKCNEELNNLWSECNRYGPDSQQCNWANQDASSVCSTRDSVCD